jgi:hypothetical protein
VSKLKTPREKKLASLALDRRNNYGENKKSSRKNIPKSKQRSHQVLRRQAKQPLANITSQLPEDQIDFVESVVLTSEIKNKRAGFTKDPDIPLGDFIDCQDREAEWRAQGARRKRALHNSIIEGNTTE